jgi:hypothetical protein
MKTNRICPHFFNYTFNPPSETRFKEYEIANLPTVQKTNKHYEWQLRLPEYQEQVGGPTTENPDVFDVNCSRTMFNPITGGITQNKKQHSDCNYLKNQMRRTCSFFDLDLQD